MSQANVRTMQRAFDSVAASDRLDAVLDLLDPSVELHGAVGGVEEGAIVRGVEPVAEALLVDSDTWAERRYEIQRLLDAGERVVALVREHRRGRGSGVEVHADMALIYTFAAGRIVRIEPYMSQDEALEAVGMGQG